MHEVSVATAIVRAVLDAVPGRSVEAVEVDVGTMSGVVPQALDFAWDVATAETSLEGAALVIEVIPLTVYCEDCSAVVTPDLGFACPVCGTLSGDVRSGRELDVRAARVRDEAVHA